MNADQTPVNSPLRKLSAQEFIDIITEADKERYAEFYGIPSNYPVEAINIKNVDVADHIELGDDVEVNLPLFIQNSFFSNGIVVSGGKFNNIFQLENVSISWLLIREGIFGDVEILSGTFGYVRISGGTFNGNLSIKDGIFNEAFRVVENCTFTKNFIIEDGNFNRDFRIESGIFKGVFSLQGGKFHQGFGIWKGTFDGPFGINGGRFDGEFFIADGLFNGEFSVGNAKFNVEFLIEGGVFKKDVTFRSGYIYRFRIRGLETPIRLQIERDCRINSLQLSSMVPKDSVIQISGEFYSLTFNDLHNLGTIIPAKVSARKVPLYPNDKKPVTVMGEMFESSRLLTYHDQIESAQIWIGNSDLGKVIFMGCDLSGFGLHFDSSKITDVFVTGTKMPREIVTPDAGQQQLGYSQIKKIYEARGDRVEANRYYGQEMDAYYSTLSWRKDGWEKLNLWLNNISTKHGQSWQRGLGTTLLVSAIFYGVYCWILGYCPALPTADHFNEFSHVASYFLEFLNPIHKADYVAGELLRNEVQTAGKGSTQSINISGWARVTEGVSRIFIAYFVYQLIQAFRKHGKASG